MSAALSEFVIACRIAKQRFNLVRVIHRRCTRGQQDAVLAVPNRNAAAIRSNEWKRIGIGFAADNSVSFAAGRKEHEIGFEQQALKLATLLRHSFIEKRYYAESSIIRRAWRYATDNREGSFNATAAQFAQCAQGNVAAFALPIHGYEQQAAITG